MTYQVSFTEQNNPTKTPITVQDEQIDNSRSITFVGQNYSGYGEPIANNFLHILENFANIDPPNNPVQGQVWFDNKNQQLNVNIDGTETSWAPAGSVFKSVTAPTTPSLGDIWVDTINQQMNLYNGGAWVLVGPQYSAGTLTGQKVETIIDTNNISQGVISLYSNNERVAIISKTAFTPKKVIVGFSSIKQGITLYGLTTTNTTPEYKFYGTATSADSIGEINPDNIVTTQKDSVITGSLTMVGLNIGNVAMREDPLVATNYQIAASDINNTIEIKINDAPTVFVKAGAVGVNTKIITANSALDVNGKLVVSGSNGKLEIQNTAVAKTSAEVAASSDGAQPASVQIHGGAFISKNLVVGANLTVENGSIILGNNLTQGSVILPDTTDVYDIGSDTLKFNTVFLKTLSSDFIQGINIQATGGFTGNVTGNVSGTANGLSNQSSFQMIGDVTCEAVTYNGTQPDVVFDTTISNGLISNQAELTDSTDNDYMLIHRPYSAESTGYISGTTLTIVHMISYNTELQPGMAIYHANNGDIVSIGTLVSVILGSGGSQWRISNSLSIGGVNDEPAVFYFGSPGLFKTHKLHFFKKVPTVQPGTIVLIPESALLETEFTGYKQCDGSVLDVTHYYSLYRLLGSDRIPGTNTFALPTITAPTSVDIPLVYAIFTGVL